MKSKPNKSILKDVRDEIGTIAEDMLYSYREIFENSSAMYDESDLRIPLYTTTERLLSEFRKDVYAVLQEMLEEE